MKLNVSLQTPSEIFVGETFSLTVPACETVLELKARVAAVAECPFDDGEVFISSSPHETQKMLNNGDRLIEAGVKDHDSLNFVVNASEKVLNQQLKQLLQGRTLSVDELNLMYCHRYGATALDALRFVGAKSTLSQFLLLNTKDFNVEKGNVTTVIDRTPEASHKPAATMQGSLQVIPETTTPFGTYPMEVCVKIVIDNGFCTKDNGIISDEQFIIKSDGMETIGSFKNRIAKMEGLPFPNVVVTAFEDESVYSDNKFISECCSNLRIVISPDENFLVSQLLSIVKAKGRISCEELSNIYCIKFGTAPANMIRALGYNTHKTKLGDFIRIHNEDFVLENGGCISASMDSIEAVIASTYLDVASVSKAPMPGGIESVLFISGLPPDQESDGKSGIIAGWLPSFLDGVAQTIKMNDRLDVHAVCVVDDFISVKMKDEQELILRFSPVIASS